MQDVARLGIAVDSRQVRAATDDVRKLGTAGEGAERIAHRVGKAWGVAAGLISSAVIVGGVTAIVRATIEQERALAQLDARLRSTGGAVGMTRDELSSLASQLQSVTTFGDETIMSAQGMLLTFTKIGREVFPQATETVLNMSIALGTDLKSAALQLGKALNDPVLGVTALSRAGVQFTKDQKAMIKAMVDANDITAAQKMILAELETQMGGAARAARDTLGGAIEGLKNAFGDLLEGDSGSEGIKGVTAGINSLTATLQSPQTQAGFQAFISGLADMANFALQAIARIMELRQAADIGGAGGDIGNASEAAASERLAQLRKRLKDIEAARGGDVSAFMRVQATADLSKRSGWTLGGQERDARAEQERIMEGLRQRRIDARRQDWQKPIELDRYEGSKTYEIEDPKAKGAADRAAKAAERLREQREREFQSLKESLRNEEQVIQDSYAERQRIIETSTAAGSEERKRLSGLSKELYEEEMAQLNAARNRDVEALRQSLLTQEEAVRESYERRLQIIDDNVTLDDDARERLRQKVTDAYQQDLDALAEAEQRKRDMLWQGLMTEEEMMLAYHERKREEILRATEVTERERQELLRREEERFMQESAARERQRIQMITSSAGDMFGALGQLMATYAQGADKENRKLFKLAQAFSIAQAVMSIATGISKAQELGYPMNIFEAIRVAAVGAVQIATIKSQQYAGAYDQGGQIPAGKWGWVGEYGPERVRGPVTVQGRKTSERYADSSGGGVQLSVVVNMNEGGTAQTQTGRSSDGTAQQEQMGRELGILVGNRVQEEMVLQTRPGGLLWKMQNGG